MSETAYTVTYDGLGRMTNWSESYQNQSYSRTLSASGDVTSSPSVPTTTYDDAHRGNTWTYDDRGNMTGVTSGQFFAWDSLDRLATRDPVGPNHIDEQYAGSTLIKETGPTSTISYTQDVDSDLSQILVSDKDGTRTNYIYGPDGTRLAEVTGSTRVWDIPSDRGSLAAQQSSTGTVLGRRMYTPEGLQTSGAGSVNSIFGYLGELQDPAWNMSYFRDRWYDNGYGFLFGRDPLNKDTNPYLYAGGDPLGSDDRTGDVRSISCPGQRQSGNGCAPKAKLPSVSGGGESRAAEFMRKVRDIAAKSVPNIINNEEPCVPPFGILMRVYDPTDLDAQNYVCLHLQTLTYTPVDTPRIAQPQVPLIIGPDGIICNAAQQSNANPDEGAEQRNANPNPNADDYPPVPGLVDKFKRKAYLYIRDWWLSGPDIKAYLFKRGLDKVPSKSEPWGAFTLFKEDGSIEQIGLYDGEGNIIVHIDPADTSTRNWHFHEFNIPGNEQTGHGIRYKHPEIAELGTFLESLGFPNDWMTPP